MKTIARWESPKGKHWVELELSEAGYYGYRGNGCGGSVVADNEESAIAYLQLRVDSGYFLPDAAKQPMKRVS